MATSGQITFSVSAQDIITEALELLGVLGEGQAPTADQITSSNRTLNMLVKTWQADGLNLFAVKKLYLFLTRGQKQYELSSSTSDHFTAQMYETTVDGEVDAGNTAVTLSDATGAAIGSKVGIYTTEGRMVWYELTDAVSGNIITLPSTTTVDIDDGAPVYIYNTVASRPMKVMESYLHQFGGTDIPVEIFARKQYNELSDKSSEGQVLQIYFDPQVSTSYLNVWPVTSDERDILVLFVQRTLETFVDDADTPDYPQEWYMPLAVNLAMHLAPKYGTPENDYRRVRDQADFLYEMAKGFDREWATSMYFEPDFMARGR